MENLLCPYLNKWYLIRGRVRYVLKIGDQDHLAESRKESVSGLLRLLIQREIDTYQAAINCERK